MATIRVVPSGTHWLVKKGRRHVSNHRKKSAAKSAARSVAGTGDTLIIHRSNGTVQKRRSY